MLIFLHFVAAVVWAVLGGVPTALVCYSLWGAPAALVGGVLMGALGVQHDLAVRPNWADALYESLRTSLARRRRRREYHERQQSRARRETRRNAALTLLTLALLLASAGALAIPGIALASVPIIPTRKRDRRECTIHCDCNNPPPPEYDSAPGCPVCSGPGIPLGSLGNIFHFSCRDCGMGFHSEVRKTPDDWNEEREDRLRDAAYGACLSCLRSIPQDSNGNEDIFPCDSDAVFHCVHCGPSHPVDIFEPTKTIIVDAAIAAEYESKNGPTV